MILDCIWFSIIWYFSHAGWISVDTALEFGLGGVAGALVSAVPLPLLSRLRGLLAISFSIALYLTTPKSLVSWIPSLIYYFRPLLFAAEGVLLTSFVTKSALFLQLHTDSWPTLSRTAMLAGTFVPIPMILGLSGHVYFNDYLTPFYASTLSILLCLLLFGIIAGVAKEKGILYIPMLIGLITVWQFFESFRGYLFKQGLEVESPVWSLRWLWPSFFSLAALFSLPLLFFNEDTHYFGAAKTGAEQLSRSSLAPVLVYLLVVVGVWSSLNIIPTDAGLSKFIEMAAVMLCYYYWLFIYQDGGNS